MCIWESEYWKDQHIVSKKQNYEIQEKATIRKTRDAFQEQITPLRNSPPLRNIFHKTTNKGLKRFFTERHLARLKISFVLFGNPEFPSQLKEKA